MFRQFASAVLFITLSIGCSDGSSTSGSERHGDSTGGLPTLSGPTGDALVARLDEITAGGIQFRAFEKTNGMAGEFMGVQAYELEFSAIGKAGRRMGGRGPNWRDCDDRFPQMCNQFGFVVEPGQEYPFEGSATYHLKENGWDLVSGSASVVEN